MYFCLYHTSYRRNTIFPCKSLVCFIIFALSIVNVSPTQLDIEEKLLTYPDTKHVQPPYSHQSGKRDGSIITVQVQGFYITTIYTNDGLSEYDVIVDTGSSLTWVGADPKNPYAIGPSGRYTGKELTINYHRGKFEGVEYIDSIILETSAGSDALVINAQAVGVAVQVTDFSSLLDGILGLGRKEASALRGADGNPIPTAVDNLYAQGTIKCAAFGVYFIPLNDRGVGEITFGYYNEAVITSGLSYVPITNVPPASNSWGIDGSIAYGGQTILSLMSGVIDTGSMVIGMVIDSALEYLSATGATMDSEGWLTISLEQYNNLQTLSIIIGGQSYDLSPNAQICARATLSSPIKLVVAGAFDSRWGFTLGHPFIQRYYIVFNATGSQIGFASTHNTWSTTN